MMQETMTIASNALEGQHHDGGLSRATSASMRGPMMLATTMIARDVMEDIQGGGGQQVALINVVQVTTLQETLTHASNTREGTRVGGARRHGLNARRAIFMQGGPRMIVRGAQQELLAGDVQLRALLAVGGSMIKVPLMIVRHAM